MLSEESFNKPAPWYRRPPVIIALVSVVALAAVAAYFFATRGGAPGSQAHYDELERHRAAQQQQAATDGTQAAPAEQAAAAAPVEGQPAVEGAAAQPGAPAGEQPATAAGAATAPAAGAAGGGRRYWTNFRGPSRDGRYEERQVKTSWPAEGLQLLWKQPVGGGYASFVVADGTAYTIEQRRGQEVVAAYNASTGRELWTNAWNATFSPDDTGDGPRSTPTFDDGRLYALGATGEFRCLDAKTGRAIWSKNILSDNGAQNIQWGQAAAPLIVDDKVIVMPGGTSGKTVVAYNKMTGARVWNSMSDQASYTSPVLTTLAGRRQIVVVTARRLAGLAPEDGAVLWEHPWSNGYGINVSQPIVVAANRVFISSGYGKGSALVEVAGSGNTYTARAVWENTSLKAKFNSPVYHDGHVYGFDESIMACIDVNTGERKWKGGRYGYGQVIFASGHLIVTTEEGDVVLVRATPAAHTEVARFKAVEGKTWNVPVIADGRLLVRNANEMAAFKLSD
ncbi:MAG TPA: PQQ-binding-like beta-propeller repeat protein [Pyrinomonadaceae bacterium]